MIRLVPAGLALAVLAGPVAAQSGAGRLRWTVAAGMNRGVAYHAPIAPSGRTVGRSMSVGAGPALGQRPIVPRLALSYHQTLADSSDINTVRLEADGFLSILRGRAVVPYLGAGIGSHASWFDRCDLVDPADPAPCSGRRTGLGWQATVGVHFPARTGPAASVSIRYMTNARAFDGVVVTLGLAL
jgi:hypothetical protein